MQLSELYEAKVGSSWIADLTSTGQHATMSLKNGKIYQILNIDPDEFERWLASPSKGNYFNNEIRNEYTVNRVR